METREQSLRPWTGKVHDDKGYYSDRSYHLKYAPAEGSHKVLKLIVGKDAFADSQDSTQLTEDAHEVMSGRTIDKGIAAIRRVPDRAGFPDENACINTNSFDSEICKRV